MVRINEMIENLTSKVDCQDSIQSNVELPFGVVLEAEVKTDREEDEVAVKIHEERRPGCGLMLRN